MEHTSGTSEEQTPVLFGRGWWNEQEERALRLNAVVARVLDEHPHARRATLTTPVCNGQACYTNWLAHGERTVGSTLYVNLARHPVFPQGRGLRAHGRGNHRLVAALSRH